MESPVIGGTATKSGVPEGRVGWRAGIVSSVGDLAREHHDERRWSQ